MFDFREVREGDVPFLAKRLREADKAEVLCMFESVEHALYQSVAATPSPVIGCLKETGEPGAIFGVSPSQLRVDMGVPWFLGTEDAERYPRAFIRQSRTWLSAMEEQYPILSNYVDSRNTKRLEWLRWLGFEFGAVTPFGADQVPFIHFFKVNHVRSS